MATLTKGKTFTNGELVTPANLHQMVDAATVANIVNADIAANAAIADTKLATISTANKVSQSAVTNLTTDLAGKAASIHQHAIADTTGLQTALDGKAAASHNHDDRYYTESEMNTLLAGKQASGSYAPASGIAPSAITGTAVITTDSRLSDARTPTTHTHDDRYYTETEIDTKLSGLPVSGHTHTIAQVTGLQTALDGKQASGSYAAAAHTHDDRYYTESEMNTLLAGKQASGSYAPATGIAATAITGTAVITTDSRLSDARTPTTHTHDDRYYTESEMNTLLAGKQASGSYAPATGIAPSAITGTAVITTDSRLSDARTPIDSSVSFSKLVQAVQETLVPTGSVVAFAFNAFAGIPDGWIECNGSAVSRSTYSNLYSKIGVSYGSGDGSTTFNLPDLRGYFIRGSGTNSDGTASGSFATKQSDDVKPHNHPVSWAFGNCVLNVHETQGGRSTGSATTVTDINVSTGFPSASIAIQTNLGTETRPKNIAMMYCIKT
jgi:microcystin-dependent protein